MALLDKHKTIEKNASILLVLSLLVVLIGFSMVYAIVSSGAGAVRCYLTTLQLIIYPSNPPIAQ
jgi:hypothetical protein